MMRIRMFFIVLAVLVWAAAAEKPLKVYLLAGQSNMQGHASVSTFDSLADGAKTAALLNEMRGRTVAPRCELVRDKWGIPHVFAELEADGFYGLGYACAEDRRLQMELVRRKAAGRLAELFGAEWVDTDRDARINGYVSYAPRAFAKLPARWQDALRAYSAGVNAWTAANSAVVARRFKPLGVQPEPWTPSDCLLAARGLLNLESPASAQPIEQYYRFQELVAQVGKEEAERRSSMFVDDSGAVVSEAEMARDAKPYARLKAAPRMRGYNLLPAGALDEPRKMSHAWAVSGRRSATGRPILESDPQLPVGSPAFLHEFHLRAGTIDARGLGIPGCPGLFIGFNRHVAWGVSALGTDSPVVFLDKHTRDRKGFQFRGQTVPFERRLERIRVKDGQTVVQEVLTNRHGAVVNSLVAPMLPGDAVVLHDPMTMEAGASARALLEMMTATNWAQFRRGMEFYYWPGAHVVYADSAGNIGYQCLVHRPMTSRSPRLALEGWTGGDEITARIPLDEMPHMLNPKAGVVSHANNLPVGSWYSYDLGIATGGTGNTGRSLRLHQLLAGTRKFSLDDFERLLHRDDVNPLVASLLPAARAVVEEDRVQNPEVLRLLDALKGWDMRESSVERFPAARAIRNTLTPYRGAGLNQRFGSGGGGVANLAGAVAEGFARDGSTPKDPAVRAYLVRWLEVSAGGRTAGRGGADEWTSRMGTGASAAGQTILIPYQRTEPHGFPAVDPSLDITSPPLKCIDTGTIWSQPGNFYTQIVDLGNVDNSRSMIAPGNSEDGAWRTNQIGTWAKGTTHAAPLSRTSVLALAASRRALTPRPYQGPVSSPLCIVAEAVEGDRYVEAIPRPAAQPALQVPSNAQGRRPDDPTLEAAFRFLLSPNNRPSAEQIDSKLAEMREYVKRNPALADEFREALRFGIYLIAEAREGRLNIPYGGDACLSRMKAALDEIGPGARRDSSATQRSDGSAR
jgi:penicillin amidase